ncbi:MAG: hypothetical protein AMXMBFR84_44340 [Candidatus Hydrogenedentota bacterium]
MRKIPSAVVIAMAILLSQFATAQRTSIGIVPFDNKAEVDYSVSDVLVDMLTTALVKSSKFDVLERSQLATVIEEQALGASGAVDSATAAQIGKLTGADYMLIVIVSECGYATKTTQVYDITVAKGSAVLAVDIRFVDSTSGQTMFAETFRQVRTATSVAPGTVNLDLRVGIGHEMARDVIDGVAGKTLIAVYPPKIAKIAPDGEIILNYGDVMFKAGQVWNVFRPGEEVIDPDTKESLGRDEEKIGQLRIVSTAGTMSKATKISGELMEGDICRGPVSSGSGSGQKATEKPREKPNPFR